MFNVDSNLKNIARELKGLSELFGEDLLFRRKNEYMAVMFTSELSEDLNCTCNACKWEGKITEINNIINIEERLTAGGIIPAGECPQCRNLVYINEMC